MKITTTEFIKSAADKSGFYTDENLYQFAVVGKSNVGKSSFINMLAGRNKLAKTSSTPGRTRLVNYFDFKHFILTDLPGYGYAKVARNEQKKWEYLIEDYLLFEPTLLRVIMLVDIRHDPTALDVQLVKYLYSNMLPFNIIATKADKINRMQIKKRLSEIASFLKIGADNMIAVSSEDKRGREDVINLIEKIIAEKNSNNELLKSIDEE